MTLSGLVLLLSAGSGAVTLRTAQAARAPAPVALACPLASPVLSGPGLSLAAPGGSAVLPAAPAPVPELRPSPPGPSAGDSRYLLDRLSARVAGADLSKPEGQEALVGSLFGETLEEGEHVYPRLISFEEARRREAVVSRRKHLLAQAVREALPALSASVRTGGWNGSGTTLDTPCCGDAAPKLAFLLRRRGHAVNVVEAEFHYYLMQAVEGVQLFVDPTIRQFFGGPRAPPDVPAVFVGTIEDLNDLFKRHATAKTTSYGIQRIYFQSSRVSNRKRVEVEDAAGSSPDAPQYRALLSLPRS